MRTKASRIVEYWMENRDEILTLGKVAKLICDGNCVSNRKKMKPHVLAARVIIEEQLGHYVYVAFQDEKRTKVFGYKIVSSPEEKHMYVRDLAKRLKRATHHSKRLLVGKENLLRKELPIPSDQQLLEHKPKVF